MLLELLSENSSLEKSRRAVLTVSLLIFFFSAVDFRSDEIEIFSLKVAFSQGRFVALGQLCISYFLVIYLIRIFIQIGDYLAVQGIQAVKNWEKIEKQRVDQARNPMYDEDYQNNKPYMDGYSGIHIIVYPRYARYKSFKDWIDFFDFASKAFLDYGIPLILGIAALRHPDSLSVLLKFYIN